MSEAPAQPPIVSGTDLGEYLVLQPVATRPASEQRPCVFRALHKATLAEVALTLFPASPQHQPMFEAGLQRYRQTTSPVLMPIRDGGVLDRWFFVATDWVPSISLRAILRAGGGLPLDQAGKILWSMATALETLHAQGLVHGNLQPDNVRVRPSGEVRVVGFFPAPYGYPQPSHHPEERILRYAAPEWFREQKYGPESDLYSFGVVAYEVFTGKALLPAGTVRETYAKQAQIQQVLDKVDQLTRAIPPSLDEVVRGMLDVDPTRRQGGAARMMDEIKRLAPRSLTGAPLPERLGRRFVTAVELTRQGLLDGAEHSLQNNESLVAAACLARAADLPRSETSPDSDRAADLLRGCLWASFRFPEPDDDVARDPLHDVGEALCYLLTRAARRQGSKLLGLATQRRMMRFASPSRSPEAGLSVPAPPQLDEEVEKLRQWLLVHPGDKHALATLAALSEEFQPGFDLTVPAMQADLLELHGLYTAALYYRAQDLVRPELAPAVLEDIAALLPRARAGEDDPAPTIAPPAPPTTEAPLPETVSGIFDGSSGLDSIELDTSPPSLLGLEEEGDMLLETVMSAAAEVLGDEDT